MPYKLLLSETTLTLSLSGSVDLSETSEIKETIKSEPKAGFNKFVIEAEEVEYMDSSAVAVMIFVKRIAEENQLKFSISSISAEGEKIIKLAGLSSLFVLPKSKSGSDEILQDNADLTEDKPLDIDLTEDKSEIDDGKVDTGKESVENHDKEKDKDLTDDEFSFKPGTFE
jgi:anti-sigma B factor antagonist